MNGAFTPTGMTTADWALVVSLFSFAVSLAGFVWAIWSKWIYPKARVRTNMVVMNMAGGGIGLSPPFIAISATNYGPSETTLKTLVCRSKAPGWWRKRGNARWKWALLNHSLTPDDTLSGIHAPFAGLPYKLPIGGEHAVYMHFKHEHLRDEDIVDVGLVDVFDRKHWVPRKSVREVVERIKKDFPKEAP